MFSTRTLFLPFLLWWEIEAKFPGSLKDLEYDVYPRRTQEEAAVLEWGHSAIISALDGSVAHFGPQTSHAALLEVEAQPVLAVPLNGVFNKTNASSSVGSSSQTIRPLYNEEEVNGNMVVMTNTGELSGVHLAKIAKASGAAALLVVNVDEDRPDDIYRLPADEEGADEIDIPVVMISLNSANVLTTATISQDMVGDHDVVNNGMPERVRLYAGGDRPFFEDIEPIDPTLYLIHNLFSSEECDAMVKKAASKVEPVVESDILQHSVEVEKYFNVQRVMLWKGLLQTPATKQIEERIEQVTGFPASHYGDFVVDRLEAGSYWEPHYDTHPNQIPMATILVFLTTEGGAVIYPSGKDKPLKILPQKGLAILHQNLNERHELDRFSRHAILPPETGPVYVARKYIFETQVTYARRVALPLFAFPFGGKLPKFMVKIHDYFIYRYGLGYGALYFDRLCLFFPALAIIGLVQIIGASVRNWMAKRAKHDPKDTANAKAKEPAQKKGKPNGKSKDKENEKAGEKSDAKKTTTKENEPAKEGNNKLNNGKDKEDVKDNHKNDTLNDGKSKKTSDKKKAKQNGKQKKSSKAAQ
jgi:hypothetical protein